MNSLFYKGILADAKMAFLKAIRIDLALAQAHFILAVNYLRRQE
jgi:hypothetical protein